MSESEFIAENKKRYAILFAEYNPLLGAGSPIDRFPVTYYIQKNKPVTIFLPLSMKKEPIVLAIIKNPDLLQLSSITFGGRVDCLSLFMLVFQKVRFKHDFEFWAFMTAKIQDKFTKKIVPFKQRLAQRMLLKELEDMRLTWMPIRLILLKARQYGGSTLIQMYMLWIQTELKKNWHSAVCAMDEGQSRNIRGMYTRAVREFPKSIGAITLIPHEGSSKNKVVAERGCIIGIGSMQMPDNLRSYDFSMLHLSECGLWKETLGKKPEDLVQTLRSALSNIPMTLEVLESTAKGVGNFFHREWLDAVNKVSGYKAIFIPWYMIDIYLRPIDDKLEFIKNMTPYDLFQWNCGATLEGINWYKRFKADNRYSTWRMQAEFPTTSLEAFSSTGSRVFAPEYVQNMRKYCCDPEWKGQLFAKGRKGKDAFVNLEFKEVPEGELWVWAPPDRSIECLNRYITTVDIGGRTEGADFSTVRVLDRYWKMYGGASEMVVTWKGHLDQDLFAWVAVQIAYFWNKSKFIVETNSLRKETISSEGDHYLTILDEIAEVYDNVFVRVSPEKVKGNPPVLYGLHMGQNKTMIIDAQNAALRDQTYIERDIRVLDECDTYENKPDGTLGAVDGCHDDLVIPSAMANWADNSPIAMGPCKEVDRDNKVIKKKIISEASL